MADDIQLNLGTGGEVLATDDDGTRHWQWTKLAFGGDGTFTKVAAGTGLPVDGSGVTQPVSASALPLPSGAATSAAQLADGHNVTIDNATGAAAVYIQDGGNSITVDATALPLPSGAATSAAQLADGHSVTLAVNDGVDVGDVDVTSVVPGTAATNLGKARDSVVGATDTGVALLAEHRADQVHLTSAEGDYDVLSLDSLGSLHVNAEAHHTFDTFNATTGWSALGNDTLNLATTKKHVTGTDALSFDKVNGAANTVFAGIQKTLTSVDLGAVSAHDLLQGSFYIPDLTNVAYAFLRLGTDATNYNEWRLPDSVLTAAIFETGALTIGDADYAGITGNGWDPSAVTYICAGVAFDSETDTLAGIVFDEVSYHTNQHTSASLNSEVSTSVSSPNVRINGYGGSTDTNAGNASNSTLRVVVATDQAAVTVDGSAVTQPVSAASLPLPSGAATSAAQLADGHNVTVDNTSVPTTQLVATSASGTTSALDTAATQIVAANAARKSCLLYTLAGASTVYIGVGETATAAMMPLLATVPLVVECVGAIQARNDSGGAVSIRYMDESY